tara:strand:+ start:546 stop:968 length:423 start_codon:yes stop_codon:yes gene_type:complete
MSIQEILGKDPKRWKYVECTEILNGDTTPEQKQIASDRQASIKAWLKSKEDASGNPGRVLSSPPPTQPLTQQSVEPSKPLPNATEEDLKYNEGLLKAAGRFDRLAVYRLTEKGIPLRGDIVNAERNFLINLERLRTNNNS